MNGVAVAGSPERGATAAALQPREEHPSTLQHDLVQGVAGLLRNEEGADLHVSCGALRIYCHSLVLRLRCPSLLSALEEPSEDEDATELRDSRGHRRPSLPSLPADLAPGPFDTLLTYLYTDTLSDGFTDEHLGPLIEACGRYELPRLAELCERRLQGELSPQRAPGVLSLAQQAGATRLQHATEAYLAEELDACLAAGTFAALFCIPGMLVFAAAFHPQAPLLTTYLPGTY